MAAFCAFSPQFPICDSDTRRVMHVEAEMTYPEIGHRIFLYLKGKGGQMFPGTLVKTPCTTQKALNLCNTCLHSLVRRVVCARRNNLVLHCWIYYFPDHHKHLFYFNPFFRKTSLVKPP